MIEQEWDFKLKRVTNGYIIEQRLTHMQAITVFSDNQDPGVHPDLGRLCSLNEAMTFIVSNSLSMTEALCESAGVEVTSPLNQYTFQVGVDIIEPDEPSEDEGYNPSHDPNYDQDQEGSPEGDCPHCYTAGGGGQLAIGACYKYGLVDMDCAVECPDLDEEE